LETGLIIKSTGSWFAVRKQDGLVINCKIKGSFRTMGIRNTNPVAVGDHVSLMVDGGHGIIRKIEPRKNYIIRKSPNLSKETQIIAANIDQALLVVTLVFPKLSTEFIDRFLVTAEAYRIPSILIFNKTDLYDEQKLKELEMIRSVYEEAGYKTIKISATDRTNLEKIKNLMKDKINLIAGQSGVGKSTILNAIDSNLKLRTEKISKSHKTGKHTTTYAEMHFLGFGGSAIDTPGIKGFGLVDFEKEEIYHYFPEIFKASKNCEYNNCSHTHETNCAVKKSVEKGEISKTRYRNYLRILEDKGEKYRG
jgi:ribosome biogenesis GTPase